MIAAMGLNREIGKDNDLLWCLCDDIRRFKKLTMGKTMVMGMNTFKSLPKSLPGRKHIVLTRSTDCIKDPNVIIVNDFAKLLSYLKELDEEVMVIGGGQIYELFLPYAEKIYLTIVGAEFPEADTFFPHFSEYFDVKEMTSHPRDKRNEYPYFFCECIKKA